MPAYKDSKKNTWYVKFRYTNWQGNRKETTKRGFATKREAKEYEAEFIRKAQGTADMTLHSLYEIYLEDRKQNIKESSLDTMRMSMEAHILPYLGDMTLSDITPNTIRKWQNHLSSYEKKHGGALKPSTLLGINRRLSALLNFGVKYYGLVRNPVSVAGPQGRMEKRLDFWSKEEFDQFIDAVREPLYKDLFLLLFYSGMRIGEAMALEKEDLDFAARTVTVNKNRSIKGKVTTPKTAASNRVITLPVHIMDTLKALCNALPDSTLLFPITYMSIKRRFIQAIEKSHVRPLTIHSLRHAHASILIAKGVPITAISKRLGHTSPQITLNVYAHAMHDSDKAIADTLENL